MKFHILYPILIFFSPIFLQAQKGASPLSKKLAEWQIKPIAAMQVWSTYTIGAEVFDADMLRFVPVDDRLNFQLHRSRLGIKGQPYENLSFNFTTAFDFVGQDILGGTEQGGNNGSSPALRLWNATVHWQVKPGNDAVNLTVGYFLPQIGRESITAALRSTSFEKSWSQNYLRRHLVGTGPGRAGGLNIGGLVSDKVDNFGFGYDVGVFNAQFNNFGGNSGGNTYSPLFVGRFVAYFGDPEMKKYSLGHKVNYFGKRNGLSLGLSAARQGKAGRFQESTALGVDFLFNRGNFNLDGDWSLLRREDRAANNVSFSANSNTGYLRASYNLELKNGFVLEPTIMHMQFNGERQILEQAKASTLGMPSGEERITNFGFNLYPNPNLKLSLFYTMREGDSGESGDRAGVNNYFFQGGIGPVRRGEYLGLGLVAVF